MRTLTLSARADRRGNATVLAILTLLVIGGLAGVVLTVAQRHSGEITAMAEQNHAFFVAQAGANEAVTRVAAGDLATIGSADEPLEFSGGTYWAEVVDSGDETITVTAHARAGLQKKAIEVVLHQEIQGVYNNGIFAGNSSGDASYTLDLGGTKTQADQVYGDVYSGGSVDVKGDSEVFGTIRAVGSVAGKGSTTAETGKKQAIPDIAGMNYAVTADIKVADEFASGGAVYKSNSAGGKAWQLPEANPASIFRKNPDDRSSETGGTVKDDYFLEDPYEKVQSDSKSDGSDAYKITLSGVSGRPGPDSNQKVFFIDGNLWIHNYQTMSLKFSHNDPNGIQVTFVVRGNIYISDNIFYSNNKTDGVAFIAMKDSKVADSGNIYFGDPKFGTLEQMHAFMYAENNFLDVNLSATGSAKVDVYGNMTAGNQVKIQRDYTTKVSGNTVIQHSKLMVDFDERIADGDLKMPGLPKNSTTEGAAMQILSWREVDP